MTERMKAFRRARTGHLRLHGPKEGLLSARAQSLLGCKDALCLARVHRLKLSRDLVNVARYENETTGR